VTGITTDYDDWAWLYDRTLGPNYCRSKLTLLDRVFFSQLPEEARVLDLCCGTGQMLPPMLARGYHVTGLDMSAGMLKYALGNAPAAEFVEGDARDFELREKVDGVLCASASLNHMRDIGELSQVFSNVYSALNKGGVFVFDINHPAQLKRHWCNQPAAGEIAGDYAWLITPRYDADNASGAFRVDMYRRPKTVKMRMGALRRFLLARPLMRRMRMQQLAKFATTHPDWDQKSTDYKIHGHTLETVLTALQNCGFEARVETASGDSNIHENSAAYFICKKPVQAVKLGAAE